MKKKLLSAVLTGLLCFQTLMSANVGMQKTEARETKDSIAITQLPGTTVVEKPYDDSFLSVTGYVKEGISDRSNYYKEFLEYNRLLKEKWIAGGNKAEDFIMQNTANYYLVDDEEEFCEAVSCQAKVIELTTDLNLGYLYLEKNEIDDWGIVGKNISSNGYLPISSPNLIEDGVSKIDFNNVHGLTIFSRNGSTIYHCELNFKQCSDIVIRNIGLQGMNEWDDTEQGKSAAGAVGGHKRYDWDDIALNECKDIWIDHCTLGIAYDGSIDICGGSSATITWCVIGRPDEVLLEEMHRTMDYLEELYQKGEAHQFYTALRDGGATKDQIFQFSLLNDKVHAFSENDQEYDKNIYDRITMAYNYYENSVQRVPQIRCGNAHMFNCWINSDAYRKIHKELSDSSIGMQKDGAGNKISPLTYASRKGCSTLGLCRANSALGGATIGTDTCIFEGVINPIISSEVEEAGPYNTGLQAGAVNHNLIVNSSTRDYGKTEYIGSSWDNNGENAFVSGDYWNGNKVSINNFKWAKWVDITKDASKAGDTVVYLPETEAAQLSYGEFYNKYYIGSDELGYEYQIVPLEDVKTTLTAYSGCGKVTMDEECWLAPEYQEEGGCKVTFDYQTGGAVSQTIFVKNGTTVGFPEEATRTGYSFDGWYTREYYLGEEDEEGVVELLYDEVPFTEETVITEDTCVYGKWSINRYKVYLDLNGAATTGPLYYECNYNSFFFVSQINNTLLQNPGYELEGWYLDSTLNKKASFFKVTDQDVTIYAKWIESKPESSESPQPSVSPQPSNIPNVSETPNHSETPDVSETPNQSETPDVSEVPDASAMPMPSSEPVQGIKGDVDGNGRVELADAQLTLKAALKIQSLEESQVKLADVDHSSDITLTDAQLILKYALKIIDRFN